MEASNYPVIGGSRFSAVANQRRSARSLDRAISAAPVRPSCRLALALVANQPFHGRLIATAGAQQIGFHVDDAAASLATTKSASDAAAQRGPQARCQEDGRDNGHGNKQDREFVHATGRRAVRSVSHRVDDVVDCEPVGQRGHGIRIPGIVGMLPGVAHVHVVVDRHNEPAVLVVDPPPPGRPAR